MRRVLVGTLILALLLPGPATLAGGRQKPPHTTLQVGGLRQQGARGPRCWTSGRRTECADFSSYRWPRAKTTHANRNARIKIRRGFRPETSRLHAYRHVDDDGNPAGDGWGVPHEVRKRTKNGRTRYFLHFHITKKEGNYYLSLDTDLAEKNGQSGEVSYFFHLELN